jgi:hypothetical protein
MLHSSLTGNLWAIVLAAGEGARLASGPPVTKHVATAGWRGRR